MPRRQVPINQPGKNLHFYWTGSSEFAVAEGTAVATRAEFIIPLIAEDSPIPQAMDDSGTSNMFLDQSLLPAKDKGASPATVKLAKGMTSATMWRQEVYAPGIVTPLFPQGSGSPCNTCVWVMTESHGNHFANFFRSLPSQNSVLNFSQSPMDSRIRS
eukprot:2080871-Amphidinium_carterae.1